MEVWGIPREQRAQHLRWRLQPDRLLRDLREAALPNRPLVELIGIKAALVDREEFERDHVPEFKSHLRDHPEIVAILKPYRDMGFPFIWSGYLDPTGMEVSLAIKRNAAAEEKLRWLVEGDRDDDDTPDDRQLDLL